MRRCRCSPRPTSRRSPRPELVEPPVPIVPMPAGRNVVEDYAHVGLTLRQHHVAFLRGELQQRRITPCVNLLTSRDGQRGTVAALVLVRQRPGTTTGVIFIIVLVATPANTWSR